MNSLCLHLRKLFTLVEFLPDIPTKTVLIKWNQPIAKEGQLTLKTKPICIPTTKMRGEWTLRDTSTLCFVNEIPFSNSTKFLVKVQEEKKQSTNFKHDHFTV